MSSAFWGTAIKCVFTSSIDLLRYSFLSTALHLNSESFTEYAFVCTPARKNANVLKQNLRGKLNFDDAPPALPSQTNFLSSWSWEYIGIVDSFHFTVYIHTSNSLNGTVLENSSSFCWSGGSWKCQMGSGKKKLHKYTVEPSQSEVVWGLAQKWFTAGSITLCVKSQNKVCAPLKLYFECLSEA